MIHKPALLRRNARMSRDDDQNVVSSDESDVDHDHDLDLQQIRDALRGLRFGTVTIIVQDGIVVQIDRTDKRRIRRNNKTETPDCKP